MSDSFFNDDHDEDYDYGGDNYGDLDYGSSVGYASRGNYTMRRRQQPNASKPKSEKERKRQQTIRKKQLAEDRERERRAELKRKYLFDEVVEGKIVQERERREGERSYI